MEKLEMKRGDHICVKHPSFGDLVTHHGIYCGDGTVIHFDGNDKLSGQATILRDSLEKFCHPLPASEILVFKQCPPGNADVVLQRAEACLGRSGYSLFNSNCEHFAIFCITNEWKSGQSDLFNDESVRFMNVVRHLGGKLSPTEIAKKAAEIQQDPVMKVVAVTGVIAGAIAISVVAGTGSYVVKKISQMKSLREAVPGDDLRLDFKLAFREAVFGGEKEIKISHLEQCQTCAGTGFQKKMLTRSSCSNCNGEGRIQVIKKLKINIPAGVDTGTRLRVANEGDAGQLGGTAGDLYVYLFVDEDKEFKRDDTNILSTIEISQAQADSGCNLNINTLDCSGSLKIPLGSKNSAVLRLNGRGVPHLGNPSERGDHLVTVNVR